ncbi:MAG TPA: alpha/beta fold hydrolase [Opitutaceae bacterium]|nr:alpha/beta fold hydrolase [Opitutaceae bacterium]
MKRSFLLPAAALAFALLPGPSSAAEKTDLSRTTPVPRDQPIPIGDFFRPSLLRSPEINDDGTFVAALITNGEDRTDLLLCDLKKNTANVLQGSNERDIYDTTWLSGNYLVFQTASEKIYGNGLTVVRADDLLNPYSLIQYCNASIIALPEADRLRPLIWMREDPFTDGLDGEPMIVDAKLDAGATPNLNSAASTWSDCVIVRKANDKHVLKRYAKPGDIPSGYVADKDGQLAFAVSCDNNGKLALHELSGEKWTKLALDLDEIDIMGPGEKPGELLVQGPRQDGKPRDLLFLDARSGTAGEALYSDSGYDFDGWVYRTPRSHMVAGYVCHQLVPKSVWFSEFYRGIQSLLDNQFKGQIARIVGSDRNEQHFLIVTYSDRHPATYHLLDITKQPAQLGLFKQSAPWLDPERMRPMSAIKYKTRDGRQLDAYLTLPAGASKQAPAPLVVLPHGGPWVRDNWGFDSEVQFLASRGYAVLQPNYRGSTGYDWMFPVSDQWAFRKMHDDVTDAVKTALKTGIIDTDRIAIMGTSFGGYLAVSGVAYEPELYRCAVTVSGVFDWAADLKRMKYNQFENPHYAYARRKLGDPEKQKAYFDSISPIGHLEQVCVPVFVAHGKEDWVVSVNESRNLISELKKRDVPVEVYLPSGEGHGMYYLKNEIELYSRIEAFLAKNMVPRTKPAATTAPGS